eukprot:s242_g16.t1
MFRMPVSAGDGLTWSAPPRHKRRKHALVATEKPPNATMAQRFMLAWRSPLRIVRSPAVPRCVNFAGYRAASALSNQDGHQPAVDNSIEAILARSRRKELMARAGPGAVRYLPSEDPNAFLLPDNRLEPAERKWQKLFVALPWLTFAAMLALPTLLVHGNLPYLLQRAEHEKQAVGRRVALADRVADFQIVNFGQMPDVLERPFPTMLILFHPATGTVFVPALRDLEGLLRKAEIPVSIAALDLTASPYTKCMQQVQPVPPDAFLWEYPAAVAPHIQLILPRSMDGEAGVVDYDGVWDAQSLAMAACRVLPGVLGSTASFSAAATSFNRW